MREVIFEVFFETFSKTLHLFGMGRGILQPQTKIFPSLVHKKMYSIKNYPLTLNAKKSCKIYTLSRKIFIKIFAPSPIPNGKGHFLSLFQKFLQKNNACHKGKRKKSHLQFVSGTDSFCLLSNNHFIGFS